MNLYVTVSGPLTIPDEMWATVERLAADAQMSPLRYLEEEPSTWWAEWADTVDLIEVNG